MSFEYSGAVWEIYSMWETIQYILWLSIPAVVANTMPVVAARLEWLSSLNRPIDGGANIIGKNKTIRGVVVGVVFGCVSAIIPYVSVNFIPYDTLLRALTYGAATSVGALVGDAVKSFFKRRIGVPSGKPWRPFDQIDSVIGAVIAASFFIDITIMQIVVAVIFLGTLSFVVSYLGNKLHIKKEI